MQRAIASGRISGPDADGLIDFARADVEWQRLTDVRRDITGAAGSSSDIPVDADGRPDFAGVNPRVRFRLQREFYAAKLRELEVRAAQGELVERRRTALAFGDHARSWSQAIFQVPARVVPMIAHLRDERRIREILRRELAEICDAAEDRIPRVLEACRG